MERRYRLKCPKCGTSFWIDLGLAKTSVFDGTLQGFRCPEKKCGAPVGRTTMKITVVGAFLIAAMAIAVILALRFLTQQRESGSQGLSSPG
jgi:hypothetical protein